MRGLKKKMHVYATSIWKLLDIKETRNRNMIKNQEKHQSTKTKNKYLKNKHNGNQTTIN